MDDFCGALVIFVSWNVRRPRPADVPCAGGAAGGACQQAGGMLAHRADACRGDADAMGICRRFYPAATFNGCREWIAYVLYRMHTLN